MVLAELLNFKNCLTELFDKLLNLPAVKQIKILDLFVRSFFGKTTEFASSKAKSKFNQNCLYDLC